MPPIREPATSVKSSLKYLQHLEVTIALCQPCRKIAAECRDAHRPGDAREEAGRAGGDKKVTSARAEKRKLARAKPEREREALLERRQLYGCGPQRQDSRSPKPGRARVGQRGQVELFGERPTSCPPKVRFSLSLFLSLSPSLAVPPLRRRSYEASKPLGVTSPTWQHRRVCASKEAA